MIIDQAKYDATSRGSARKVLCRCDTCGTEALIAKQKLYNRGGTYTRCRDCHYGRNGRSSKALIEVQCRECSASFAKRADSVKGWGGACSSCASKEIASRPEVKAILQENGRRNPPPRENVVNYRRGAANNRWRGGITPENARIRNSPATRQWRQSVFERDDFTCQICSRHGGDIEADHIMPFALHPECRLAPFNGRTLCKPCHRKYGAKVSHGVQTREPVFPEDLRKIG